MHAETQMKLLKQKRNWIYISGLLIILLVGRIIFHHVQVSVYDGFEGVKLNRNWSTSRMEPNRFKNGH
jgi:hypothetical protein